MPASTDLAYRPWCRRLQQPGETFDRSASGLAGEAGAVIGWIAGLEIMMEALFASIGLVALAEIGDKTQLLSLALAAKYRRPIPIMAGIAIATLLNHALAGALGAWLTRALGPQTLRLVLALSFLAMAAWMLIPDKLELAEPRARLGVLATTTVAFFLVEMGDKTQVATIALAAKYGAFLLVVAGTTLGMLIANAPVVAFGERILRRVPVRWVQRVAAGLFAVLGLLAALAPTA